MKKLALNYGKQLKLYMVMLGCTPEGRLTEQHDIFFGIGTSKRINPTDEGFGPQRTDSY
jgi:hypothetical protein